LGHVPAPLFKRRVPGEFRVKRPVGIFKYKMDFVAIAMTIPKGFGKTATEDIDPMRHIPLAGVVVADDGQGLVIRAACRGIRRANPWI